MSLPAPILDDRKFQELVDEAKRNISKKCPEWTDHNVSDPGVTLIELFAWMTEITLYRLNLVPERNYVKFLEMIGIDLQPGDAARTGITFPLAAGWPGERVHVPRGTEVATVPTGEEEPIVFSTDRDLYLATPEVAYVVAESGYSTWTWNHVSPFRIWNPDRPVPGDLLYLGFDRDITGYLLELTFECEHAAATGLRPQNPLGQWQYFNTALGEWRPLEPLKQRLEQEDGTFEEVADPTQGLNRSGRLLFDIPWENFDDRERKIDEKPGWWIRYQYPQGDYAYEKSPVLEGIRCRVLGGTVSASHCLRVENELLGESDGTAGQCFQLSNSPVLALQPGETVVVKMEDGGWQTWTRVDDFSASRPDDRHFTCDTVTGEIRFGPRIQRPDGSVLQLGAAPRMGSEIRFTGYRFGGGSVGNVGPGALTELRRTIPYIMDDPENPLLRLTNRDRASGGSDREELEHAKLRGRRKLRALTRAVTPSDYEYHALQAVPNSVARARCITPAYPTRQARNQRTPPPGEVRVLIVPAVSGDATRLSFEEHLRLPEPLANRIQQELDRVRLITTRVSIQPAQYLRVSTEVAIRVDHRHEPARVRAAVERALHRFINPLVGGPAEIRIIRERQGHPSPDELNPLVALRDEAAIRDRSRGANGGAGGTGQEEDEAGWPFGYPLRLVDLRSVVQSVEGVRYLENIKVFYRRSERENRVQMRGEQVELPGDFLCLSEQHVVTVTG